MNRLVECIAFIGSLDEVNAKMDRAIEAVKIIKNGYNNVDFDIKPMEFIASKSDRIMYLLTIKYY